MIYRYNIDTDDNAIFSTQFSGIVIADSTEDAIKKVEAKYSEYEIDDIWEWAEDMYYDKEHPDVIEIVGDN